MYGNNCAIADKKALPIVLPRLSKLAFKTRSSFAGWSIVSLKSAHAFLVESSIIIDLKSALSCCPSFEIDTSIPKS